MVFIDDLDRCPSEQIIKILDAVMLLLSNKKFPFLTFIAIDPRIIISSIESSFKKRVLNSGISGFEYIDKLIQIPFCIPISSPSTKKDIIEILTRDKVELLNQIFIKIIVFIDDYNLYELLNIKQEDINKMYKTKVKVINSMFLFFNKKFTNLNEKKNNHIFSLQEKCGFINKVLVFIDDKLKNKKSNESNVISNCCKIKSKRNFSDLEHEIFNEEDIINHKRLSFKTKTERLSNIPNNIIGQVDKNIHTLHLKLKDNTITDEELLILGEYLFENKKENEFILIEFNTYMRKVIDMYTKFFLIKQN